MSFSTNSNSNLVALLGLASFWVTFRLFLLLEMPSEENACSSNTNHHDRDHSESNQANAQVAYASRRGVTGASVSYTRGISAAAGAGCEK